MGQCVRRKGFTLTEVLVVIASVSLLMAVLMPALARARQQGKSVLCMSNLRQLGIAAQMYASGNDDYFPPATVTEMDGSVYKLYAWDFTTVYDSGNRYVEPGLLWQGETTERVQQCPAFKGAANWAEDKYTGYNYNTSYIGGRAAVKDGEVVSGTVVMSTKVGEVRRPEKCALFGDGQWAEGANKFMRSPFGGKLDKDFSGRYAGTQGYRHLGKTNVAWCDGSVGSVKECFTEAHASEQANIAEGTGFLSADNSAYDLE
jgi:prepilin-type N-terminal cleavage/methylation domain-containing protein/prepilin-type processing-associated H-X9-DG protein